MSQLTAIQAIKAFYGNKTAERSGVPLINHIREGEVILREFKADADTIDAWRLHPLFQADKDLESHYATLAGYGGRVAMLVMEYRHQANSWLSDKVENYSTYNSSGKLVIQDYRLVGWPKPGPIPEVRLMLIADKVQNCKDFLKHHKDSHPRNTEIDIYFNTWLQALGISSNEFGRLCALIDTYKARITNA